MSVKIVNKYNGGSATVDPALAEVLVAGGAWERADKPARKPRPKPEPEVESPDE